MKQLSSFIIFLSAALMLGISCGSDDQPSPSDGTTDTANQTSNQTNLIPLVDESSIVCDVTNKILYFHAVCPEGTKIQVLFCQRTNGAEEKWMDVSYSSASELCTVILTGLTPGASYSFFIVGYDTTGREVLRSAEQTFTLPKAASSAVLWTYDIKAFAPSSVRGTDGYLEGEVITTAVEYSIDGGETWVPVTEAGVIRNVPSGAVLLRYAETSTTEASQVSEVMVPTHEGNTDVEGKGGTSEGMRIRG